MVENILLQGFFFLCRACVSGRHCFCCSSFLKPNDFFFLGLKYRIFHKWVSMLSDKKVVFSILPQVRPKSPLVVSSFGSFFCAKCIVRFLPSVQALLSCRKVALRCVKLGFPLLLLLSCLVSRLICISPKFGFPHTNGHACANGIVA